MKYISIVVLVIVGFVGILLLTNKPIIDPFLDGINFEDQELINMDFDAELIASFQSNLKYYTQIFQRSDQSILIEDSASNAYIDITLNNIIDSRFQRLNFDSLRLETKGFENFIDTQGITGTIQASLNIFKNSENTYVENIINLIVPPFTVNAVLPEDQKQFMSNAQAQGQLLTLIDFSTLTIDPVDTFNNLVLTRDNTTIYQLKYGHKLVITNDNILFTGTESTIEVIIYNGYLVNMTLDLSGAEITIPANTIAAITEDVIVSLSVLYNFNMIQDVSKEIPYDDDDLASFRRVDTFSLPDITSFIDTFTNE